MFMIQKGGVNLNPNFTIHEAEWKKFEGDMPVATKCRTLPVPQYFNLTTSGVW